MRRLHQLTAILVVCCIASIYSQKEDPEDEYEQDEDYDTEDSYLGGEDSEDDAWMWEVESLTDFEDDDDYSVPTNDTEGSCEPHSTIVHLENRKKGGYFERRMIGVISMTTKAITSKKKCQLWKSFGFDGRVIWVSKGCGADFEVITCRPGLMEFQARLNGLKQEIEKKADGKSLQQIKSYADSTEGSLAIFQWWLMKNIQDTGQILHFGDETLNWILSNREPLEMLMTSGDVYDKRYRKALYILGHLIQIDPGIKEDSLRLRLAVATALTHSTLVMTGRGRKPTGRNEVDGVSRYQAYMKWSQEGKFLQPFFEVSAWHLRYVVDSYQSEEEQVWARENIREGYDDPLMIGMGGLNMISYDNTNKDGIRIFAGAVYYYYQPLTLKTFHEIGGVCGAVSSFRVGFCQAFGVPAAHVHQPGHSAYMWYRNGTWKLGNSLSGWTAESNMPPRVQYTWNKRAYYFPVMNEAQKNLKDYRMSEKMRILGMLANPGDRFNILEDATTRCPYNIAAWVDLEVAIMEPSLQKATVISELLPIVLAQRKKDKDIFDIALEKNVISECFGETAAQLTDSKRNKIAYCNKETGDFEIDLVKPSSITEIRMQWSKKGMPEEYDIYAMSEENNYVLVKSVRTEEDHKIEANRWIHLDGWEIKTTKIKVDVKKSKSNIDIRIRHFKVFGINLDVIINVSKGKPVTASPGSSDPEALVDGTKSTLWCGNSEDSWFEIDLKQICAISEIELSWVDSSRPEKVEVAYKVGTGPETRVSAIKPFEKVSLQMDCGSTVMVKISGGKQEVQGIKVSGVAYSTKDILKMKVNIGLEDLAITAPKMDLKNAIDKLEYLD